MSIFRFGPERAQLKYGLYEDVLTEALKRFLDSLAATEGRITKAGIDDPHDLGEHFAAAIGHAMRMAFEGFTGEHAAEKAIRLASEVLEVAARHAPGTFREGETTLHPEMLLEFAKPTSLGPGPSCARPHLPLARSRLLVNAPGERGFLQEVLSEIPSADRIDLISAFVKWSGFTKLRAALEKYCEAGKPLRVLTTVYLGATDARAVFELARLGAEVRVSYDDTSTRLHAKAWLFHRDTGLSTAYVGSSNLSRAAMTEGIEWNVRLAKAELPEVVERFEGVFRTYWEDPTANFIAYDPDRDHDRLVQALELAGKPRGASEASRTFFPLEVEPKDFQRRILDDLVVARGVRNVHSNLVVAATGTGKTVVAALDYRALRRSGIDTLLYVAHRKEILERSRVIFRQVLNLQGFGELLHQGEQVRAGRHVFASIQSLDRVLDQGRLDPAAFDMVIIDEVHHAAAPTYRSLLGHLRPRELLGLTATPERMDDDPSKALQLEDYFKRPWVSELRLWDAIEQQILVPFTYFALDDGTDLRTVPWTRGRYQVRDLSKVYDANRIWTRQVVDAVRRYVRDPSEMKALAFCVDIPHAELVAGELQRGLGVPCAALTSSCQPDLRNDLMDRFRTGGGDSDRPRVLATVDLLNEGVDLPDVDTLLLLRPTESATVFIQQLGRGLRRAEGKDCLTVLDFVGIQHDDFRFDLRYQALTGLYRGELRRSIEQGFDRLPAGCTIELEEKPRRQILEHLRRSLGVDARALADRLRACEAPEQTLSRFLEREGLEIEDVYHKTRSGRGDQDTDATKGFCTYRAIRSMAGISVIEASDREEDRILAQVGRLVHVDDLWRLEALEGLAADLGILRELRTCPSEDPVTRTRWEERLIRMLLRVLKLKIPSSAGSVRSSLEAYPASREELGQLAGAIRDSTRIRASRPSEHLDSGVPLALHGSYRTEEIAAAFDIAHTPQTGVVEAGVNDLLLVTLDKRWKSKVPHLQYQDYAISPRLFHWQSQAGTKRDSRKGRRHLDPAVVPLLFVRSVKADDRGRALPYTFLGAVARADDAGERPISITYRLLDADIPGDLLAESRVAVA